MHKEVDEPVERILVHGVDAAQVGYGKEENAAVLGHWLVDRASFVNLFLRARRDLLLAGNLFRQHLGGGENVDGGLVF